MSLIRGVSSGLRRLFRRTEVERDIHDEVEHYLEQSIRAHVSAGATREDAEHAARAGMGGTTFVKERALEGGWEHVIETVLHDVRYGARTLRRNPGFTIVAALTLALGIGANTAMFSVVNAVLLRPLPYAEPDRLAFLWTDHPRGGVHDEGTAYLTFSDWRTQNRLFTDLAIFAGQRVTITGASEPEPVTEALVSANLLPLLGVSPALGRTFTADEEARRERVVVLSHGLWLRRFGGAREVLGQTLEIDGQASRVIGVMPAGFYFPDQRTQFWEPASFAWRYDYFRTQRFRDDWGVIGRLRLGAGFGEAQAEMTAIGARLAQSYPVTEPGFAGFGVVVVPAVVEIAGRNVRLALLVLLGAVGCVLLIACTNVANLLLARGAAREREIAVRAALGAGRVRILRQLLTESVVLAVVGGALGIAVAAVSVRLLAAFALPGIARLDEVRLDGPVLAFASAVSLLTGLLFGVGPAIRMSRRDPQAALAAGGRTLSGGLRLSRVRGTLVVVECAMAVMLLAGAGLLVRSALRLRSVNLGFDPDGVLLVRLSRPTERVSLPPTASGARPNVERKPTTLSRLSSGSFFREIDQRISALPGVRGVGGVQGFVNTMNPDWTVAIEGHEPGPGQDTVRVTGATVTTGFFRTMGVPLLRGRMWREQDAMPGTARAFIVNETFARRFLPGEDPIGKRITNFEATIVGVVGDMRRQGAEREPIAEFFQVGPTSDLVVRVDRQPTAIAASVRAIVHSVDPTASVLEIAALPQHLDARSTTRRLQTWLLVLFASIALLLSAIGIFGVLQYGVTQRRQEIGVRLSLGALPSDVLRLVVVQGMRLALLGMVIGLAASLALTRVLTHLLFGVQATDPLTFGAAAAVLALVALAACALPAMRAARVNPIVALRQD